MNDPQRADDFPDPTTAPIARFPDLQPLDHCRDRALESVAVWVDLAPSLVPFRESLCTLAIANTISDYSWSFPTDVSRVIDRVPWLSGALSAFLDSAMYPVLARVAKWRQIYSRTWDKVRDLRKIRLTDKPWKPAKFTTAVPAAIAHYEAWPPSKKGLREIAPREQLRALLLLASCTWRSDPNPIAQKRLAHTVIALGGDPVLEGDHYIWVPHPLYSVISQIGSCATREELARALETCNAAIAEVDPVWAKDLRELYVPLLLGTPQTQSYNADELPSEVTVDVPVEPTEKKSPALPKKKSTRDRTTKTSKKTKLRIPTADRPLPGESIEETSSLVNISRRTAPSKKPIPLKDELAWANQRVWGQNNLLIRDHVDSLSDPEAILFGRSLIDRISLEIAANDLAAAVTGIYVGLTFALGRVSDQLQKLTIVPGKLPTKSEKNGLRIGAEDGLLQMPVVRPESAFEATRSTQMLLTKTTDRLTVALPPALAVLIRRVIDRGHVFVVQVDSTRFENSMRQYVRAMESDVGTGISIARVRRTAPARLRECSEDIVATMILAADTFGASTAPLYYACMKSHALQKQFMDAIWPLFSDNPPAHAPIGEQTWVGSQLLVTPDVARTLARSLGSGMHAPGKAGKGSLTISKDHNALVNHALGMDMTVGTHRPTDALFLQRRFDFDTKTHGAILSDKKSDLAHLHRYAPSASLLSAQIESLLDHYRALKELPDIKLLSETVEAIDGALSGTGPLFFHLDAELRPVHHVLATWTATLPPEWSQVPLNWGRTWYASAGRSACISPDCIATAMGHLEAVGYPFSKESPVEPATLSRAMHGKLDLMARNAGWMCRVGFKSTIGEAERLPELGALRDWQAELAVLDHQVQECEQNQRAVARAFIKEKTDAGNALTFEILQAELGAAAEILLTLSEIAKRNRKSGKKLTRPRHCQVTLEPEAVEGIQLRIRAATEHDKVLQIAAHNALHRYLKGAYRVFGWNCPIPAPWLASATMEPTPFFPGMMRARMQTHAMRECFTTIPVRQPVGSEFTPFEWSCGISCIALAIFGLVDRSDVLLEILRGRNKATRSKTFKDLILVPWKDQPRQVAGLRGLGAVAFARLRKQSKNDPLPTIERLESIIGCQLPAQLVGGTTDGLLKRLCATTAISNRIELSGIARSALDPDRGSVAMLPDRQRQFLEGGSGPVEDCVGASKTTALAASQFSLSESSPKLSIALGQYVELRQILNVGEGPKRFKRTDVTLSAANIVAFRSPMKAELNAFLASKELSSVVSCLAAFALHLTTHGTPEEREPVPSTVYRYVTSFAEPLIRLVGKLPFLHLEEEDYLDIYQDVVDRLRGTRLWLAARETVNFHRYLQAYHGVVNADLSSIDSSRGTRRAVVDAEIIQPHEFATARGILDSLTSPDSPERLVGGTDARRLRRQATVMALLLRQSGGRLNEIAGLRFKDILATPHCTVLLIRPSRYRKLKTGAARRLVDLTNRLTPDDRRVIANWVEAERSRLLMSWTSTSAVFGILGDAKAREKSERLRDALLDALATPVGYRSKVHRIRHLVAGEGMLPFAFSGRDWHLWQGPITKMHTPLVFPRQLRAFTVGFGHRRPSTTIENYFHMAWAWASRPHEMLTESIDSRAGAVAMGISVAGVYKILQRSNVTQRNSVAGYQLVSRWLDHIGGVPSETPGAPSLQVADPVIVGVPLSAWRIEQILGRIQRGVPPREALLSYGVSDAQAETLRRLAREIEIKTGFCVWPEQGVATEREHLRTARSFVSGTGLGYILDAIDSNGNPSDRELVISLADLYLTWANKSRRDEFCWPRRDAERLITLLGKCGINQNRVMHDETNAPSGFVKLNVKRDEDPRRRLNHSLAWLLLIARMATAERIAS